MRSLKALDSLFAQYELTSDCFKIAARAKRGRAANLLQDTSIPVGGRNALKKIQSARADTADLIVASMWAYFERELIEYVQRKGGTVARLKPRPFATVLSTKITSEIEYWRFPDILDLFSGHIDKNLLGQAKQIKQFRDWVVHRNPNKPTPSKTDPVVAYGVFRDIITQINAL